MVVRPCDNSVMRYTGTLVDGDFRGDSLELTPSSRQEANYEVKSAGGKFAKFRLIQGWVKNHDGSSLLHSQSTVEFAFEPEDATTSDDGKPHTRAFGGIFEHVKLIEGWVEFINGARFEGYCHGKSCPTIFKTFKHDKYRWNRGQCTYTGGGGSLTEGFTGKVCCITHIFARTRSMPAGASRHTSASDHGVTSP